MAPERMPLRLGIERLRDEGLLPESEHPELEELLALQAGNLAEARAATVARHLDSCLVCRELLADWGVFPDLELPPGMEPLNEEEVEAGRLRLERQLASEASQAALRRPAAVPLMPESEAPARRRRLLPRVLLSLAATVVLAAGLAFFLRSGEDGLPALAADVQTVDVDLHGSGHRGPGALIAVERSRQVLLSISGLPPGFDEYGARLLRRHDGWEALQIPLHRDQGRKKGVIEPGAVAPGIYEVSLWSRRRGVETRFGGAPILRVE
jgi:hypothetical protein